MGFFALTYCMPSSYTSRCSKCCPFGSCFFLFLTQRLKGKEGLLGKVFILTVTKHCYADGKLGALMYLQILRTNVRRNVWQSVRRTEYDC